MGIRNDVRYNGQRKVTFRLRPECWEGVSHTKVGREKEEHSNHENSKSKGPGVRTELALFFLEQKRGGWSTVSTDEVGS